MRRVMFAYKMEGCEGYPESAAGKIVKSDLSQNLFGAAIEEITEDFEELQGLTDVEVAGQAAKWRSIIDDALNAAERAALRIWYSESSCSISNACETLGRILVIDGRSTHYVTTECWIITKAPEQADKSIATMVDKLFESAISKAVTAIS